MDNQMNLCLKLFREKFDCENYCSKNDYFVIVEDGSFTYDCGSGVKTVSKHEAICFKKGVRYHRYVKQPLTIYLFRFRSTEDLFDGEKIVFKDKQRIESTLSMLNKIYDGLSYDSFSYKASLFNDIILQYIIENRSSNFEPSAYDPMIRSAITYMNDNLNNKIDLASVAEITGLSYIKFNRQFKKATGASPMDYLNAIRNKRAQQLLSSTNMKIALVAEESGFTDPYYFSNFFKKHNGISPSEYRKSTQNQ